jgi:hypothetical protein
MQISSLRNTQTLAKEKTAAVNFVANFEAQYDWIQDESEYVFCILFYMFWMVWLISMTVGAVCLGGKDRRTISCC